MKDIVEHWDSEHGVARCITHYETSCGTELNGIGIAERSKEDNEFVSELTGTVIAEYRAQIDLIKKINRYEIRPAIAALKHVYCTMQHSKRYNSKSYEAIRLKKELAHLLDELEENKIAIKNIQEDLATYMQRKDDFYQSIKKGQK